MADLFQQNGIQPTAASGGADLFAANGVAPPPAKKFGLKEFLDAQRGLSDAIGNGMSFGMMPKLVSGAMAPLQWGVQAAEEALRPKTIADLISDKNPHQSVSDFYAENLNKIRGDQDAYAQAHPLANTAANIFGGLLSFRPQAVAQQVAKGIPSMIAHGAALGVPLGAIPAFVNQDGTWGQKATAGGVGGLVGGVVGGTTPVALGAVPAVVRAVARPFMKEGTDEIAGKVLNTMAGTGGIQPAPSPLPARIPPIAAAPGVPGMELTTGQLTNNPGILSLERTLQQRNAAGGGDAMMAEAQRNASNNSTIANHIGTLGDVGADSSSALEARLANAYKVAKEANRTAWKAADVSSTGGVSGFQFNNFMNEHIANLPIADRAMIPKDVIDIMGQMSHEKTQNLSDVQAVRSLLGSRERMAYRAGDTNTARVLGNLGDRVEEFVDLKAQNLGATLPAYNAARADTAQMKQTFNTPPGVRDVLGTDSRGADKIPTSAVADTFIRKGKGAPEAFDAYLKAVGDDPEALKAARDAFAKKFLDNVQQTTSDISGGRNISSAATTNFVDDYGHIINSKIFTPSQRDLIGRIQQAADMAARTSRAGPKGGSDTASKLVGNNFLDVMIGPGASKLAPAVGAAIGLTHGPVGMAIGAAAGKGVERGLTETLFAAPREKVIELLNEAIADPKVAQALMLKASSANAKMIPSATRQKIIGIIGAQGAADAGGHEPDLWQKRQQFLPPQAGQ